MKTIIFSFLITLIALSFSFSQQKSIYFDAKDINKKINLIVGTNTGPESMGNVKKDYTTFFKDIGIQAIRTHDYYGPCDWWTIFPNWNADPNDPNSYNFTESDQKIIKIFNSGFDILFRLGTSWKGNNTLPINEPPGTIKNSSGNITHTADTNDFKKFAEICRHIIMHYCDGWANGYRLNIKKWEIWNEPTLKEQFWAGTNIQFFQMFSIVAKKIKEYYPNILIGGPAQEGQVSYKFEVDFLDYCKKTNTPLDFYSYHSYGGLKESPSPWQIPQRAIQIRDLLKTNNYNNTFVICDEWNALVNQDNFAARGKGAAFYASALIYGVYYDIPEMYQYRADNHPLGLINDDGTQIKIAAESMKAWKYLNQNQILLNSIGSHDTSGFASIATINEQKSNIRILVSNYVNIKKDLYLSIKNLNIENNTRWKVIQKLIDNKNRLAIVDSSIVNQKNDSLIITLPIDGESVKLIEITKIILSLPQKVTLVKPQNNTILKLDTIDLFWNQSNPNIDKYQIEINLGNKNIISDSSLKDTTFRFIAINKDTSYTWKIRAKNQTGWSEWSDLWTFSIEDEQKILPSKVILISPENDEKITDEEFLFTWHKSNPDVINYQIEIAKNEGPIVLDTTILDTTLVLKNMERDIKYVWRVRAKNSNGFGEWSESRIFYILIKSDVENNYFNKITLIISPNPASFYIEINCDVESGLRPVSANEINIYNILGECVLSTPALRATPQEGNFMIDISNLPNGLYYMKIANIINKFMVIK
ncbi:MAG: T9SS type A sorting domain-containing protein [Candidatus Kapabacteria bacterium]|nr:T9SS type A sorting domain-containing protein [Candidatus Kapabacteria bacterium]